MKLKSGRERRRKKKKSEKNIHIAGSPVRSSEYLIEYGPLKAYYFLNTISPSGPDLDKKCCKNNYKTLFNFVVELYKL